MNMIAGKANKGTFSAIVKGESKTSFKKKLPDEYKSFEGDCFLGFRPENTSLKLNAKKGKFHVVGIESLGSESVIHLECGKIKISAILHRPDPSFSQKFIGTNLKIDIEIEDEELRLFDSEGNSVRNK